MQGGMILNQLINHVREIILELRTEYVQIPDRITQIIDGYARYVTGRAAGLGISIPALMRRGKAKFYSGLDEAQELETNNEVERHFAYWKHMAMDVVVIGTTLKQTVGITVADLIRQDYSLGHMNENDRLMLLNLFKTEYKTAAAGIQGKKVAAMHGHFLELEADEEDRKPETLDDLFNPTGMYHGVKPNELDSWDNAHVWGRRPISNTDDDGNVSAASDAKATRDAFITANPELKYRHRPIIYTHPDNTRPSISTLEPVFRRYHNVVMGMSLSYMWAEGFSTLVQDILNKNLNVPILTLGGAGFEFDMDCVKIAGTTIINDPNAPEGTIRTLHLGTPGMEDGTYFPMYYDPMTNPIDQFRMEADMLMNNTGRPKGMTFGRPRPTPYTGSEWARSDRYQDAASSRIFLDYIPGVCTVRSYQMEQRNFVA